MCCSCNPHAAVALNLVYHRTWKGYKPNNINNHKVCFSLDDVTVGSYVCLQPHEDSEYFKVPKFEVAKVLSIPEDLTSEETEMQVEYHQFDP